MEVSPIIKHFDARAATLAVCTAWTKVEPAITNVIEFEAWQRWRKAAAHRADLAERRFCQPATGHTVKGNLFGG
jgi:hypothetical protein